MEYSVRYSARKTLALEITEDGKILVRAPYFYPGSAIEKFVISHEKWITKHRLIVAKRREQAIALPPVSDRRARDEFLGILLPRIEMYSKMMGLTPTGIRITNARKRFGSCSSKNSLCFSMILSVYPLEVIDYVIVHELAHIREHNHGHAFWRIVVTTMPDYKEREKILKHREVKYE